MSNYRCPCGRKFVTDYNFQIHWTICMEAKEFKAQVSQIIESWEIREKSLDNPEEYT